jgi:hypothetical protein
MKRLEAILVLSVLLALVGCGDNGDKTLTLTLPADTPPETVQLIKNVAPALEKQLPGLLKYQDSMTFNGIDASYPYWAAPGSGLPEDTVVTWLKFVVADDGGTIPKEYRAWGHHLRIGIVNNGEALILQKAQAQSVFLDMPVKSKDVDFVVVLK